MKYKIQDVKIVTKPEKVKKPEREVVRLEAREARDSAWGMWLLAGVSVLFLVFSLSLVFARAKVVIEAKTVTIPVDTAFNLTKTGGLVFEVAEVSGEEKKTITSETTVDFSRKATGQVILYNTTNQDQNLLIETRLSTPDGKIFKTDKAVKVPKGTADKPGSVEVGAIAETAGEDYNVGLVDLKIVGFKGTPKYEKFYGRSKTPFAGGLVGKHYTLAAADAERELVELKKNLKEKLVKQLSLQTPAGYFVLPDVLFTDTSPTSFESETSEIELAASGKLTAIILNEENFSQELAKKNIADLKDTVQIKNLRDLVFAIENKEGLKSDASTVNFKVTGDAKVVWVVDEAALKEKLTGSRRKDFSGVLTAFPAIEKAELKVLPFWKRTLPASPKHIKVLVK